MINYWGQLWMLLKNWQQRGWNKKSRDITLETKIAQTYSPIAVNFSIKVFLCRNLSTFQKLQDGTKIARNLNAFVQNYKHEIFI